MGRSRSSGRLRRGGLAGRDGGRGREVGTDGSEHGGYLVGFVGDLPVREAEDAEAGGGVDLVALHRSCLLGGRAVVAQAVGLDDEAVVGEPEVDLVAHEAVFREGEGEARRQRQGAKEDLQVRIGEAEGVAVEHGAEGLHARHADVGVEGGAKCLRVDQVEHVRLVHRPLEPQHLQFRREIDQGLDRVRHRDPATADQVLAG